MKKNIIKIVIYIIMIIVIPSVIMIYLFKAGFIRIYEEREYDIGANIIQQEDYRRIYICFSTITPIVEITLFILIRRLSKRKKFDNIYNKDYKNVIDPILAESLVDRKIDVKNLIMACIVDLVNRGNIKNINNNEFELLNTDNLSDYEKDIVGIVFYKEKDDTEKFKIKTVQEAKQEVMDWVRNIEPYPYKKAIKFDEINNIFIDKRKTKKFLNSFSSIKSKIENAFFEKGLYSKKGERFLKVVRAFIFIVYIMCVFLYSLMINSYNIKWALLGTICVSPVWLILYEILFYKNIINFRAQDIVVMSYGIIFFIMGVIYISKLEIFYILGIMLMIIVNTILLITTKTRIYTKEGEKEYIKALGLKKYIEDYSLIKDRDVDSTIIWDRYLAYAVAFGIPNKITSKLNESLMKASRINYIIGI